MGDNDTKDTYEADDSILNPSGKGEHTEVTETREDGTKDTTKPTIVFSTRVVKASIPRLPRLRTRPVGKIPTKRTTAFSIRAEKANTPK
jgi:hypothetical protein